MRLERIVAAHHRIEQPVARRLVGVAVGRRAGQDLGVDAAQEGGNQRGLVRIEPIEFRESESRRLGDVAQRNAGVALVADNPQKGVERGFLR